MFSKSDVINSDCIIENSNHVDTLNRKNSIQNSQKIDSINNILNNSEKNQKKLISLRIISIKKIEVLRSLKL